jgi:hypothetical protein
MDHRLDTEKFEHMMVRHRGTKALRQGDVVSSRLLGWRNAHPDPVSIGDEAAIIIPSFVPIYPSHSVPAHPIEITFKKLTVEAPAIIHREAPDEPTAEVMRPWSNDVDLPVEETDLIIGRYKTVSRMRITVKKTKGSALIQRLKSPEPVVYPLCIPHFARHNGANRPIEEAGNMIRPPKAEIFLLSRSRNEKCPDIVAINPFLLPGTAMQIGEQIQSAGNPVHAPGIQPGNVAPV